jgi:hypothetical protein
MHKWINFFVRWRIISKNCYELNISIKYYWFVQLLQGTWSPSTFITIKELMLEMCWQYRERNEYIVFIPPFTWFLTYVFIIVITHRYIYLYIGKWDVVCYDISSFKLIITRFVTVRLERLRDICSEPIFVDIKKKWEFNL